MGQTAVGAALFCCLMFPTTACRRQPEAPVAEKAAGASHFDASSGAASLSPLSQARLPTTAPTIAMGNLEGSISDGESRLARRTPGTDYSLMLASLHLARGRIVGKLSDYERAAELVARAFAITPKNPSVLLARAEVHSTFHRFGDALADLDRAEALGARGGELEGRAGILLGMGRLDEARPLIDGVARERPTLSSLGMQAALRAGEGRIEEAEALYVEAQSHYREVSPFPVAWLWLQQGLMWQRAGRPARARELYEAALERLPMYAPAISHLAAVEAQLGERDKAIGRLRALVVTSDDPEYLGQLAELLRDGGRQEEAERLHRDALAAYAQLLAAHPEAFADHAARVHLGWGNESAAALALAEQNLRARRTVEALQLVVEAALADGKSERACAAVTDALALAPRSSAMQTLAWKAYTACHRDDRAAAALAAASALSHPK